MVVLRGATAALASLVLMHVADTYAADAADFAPCVAQSREAPAAYDSALCFYQAAAGVGAWQAAAQAIDSLPDDAKSTWHSLVLGYLYASLADPRSRTYLMTAAEAFAAAGQVGGELQARANLRIQLFGLGDLVAARDQMLRVKQLGAMSSDPELQMRALLVEARHLIDSGRDLPRAHEALLKASSLWQPAYGYFPLRESINELGQIAALFGRYREALDRFAQFSEIAREYQDVPGEALARVNFVNTLHELVAFEPTHAPLAEVLEAARHARELAAASGIVPLEVTATRLFAELLLVSERDRALRLAVECASTAAAHELLWHEAQCLWVQSLAVAHVDPEGGTRLMDDAIRRMVAHAGEEPTQLAFAWRYKMRLSYLVKPRDQALADAHVALRAFESLRAAQPTFGARSAVLSVWSRDYRWLAGQVLLSREAKGRISDAFMVQEQMRARSLLDALSSPPAQANQISTQLLHEIAALNRQLLVAPARGAQPQLEKLAQLEQSLRNQLALDGQIAAVATLAEVQQMLGKDEAMLLFQIGHWQNPFETAPDGSWLFVVTSQHTHALKLPDRAEITALAQLLRGFNHSGTGFQRAAHTLYMRLLGPALATLPAAVNKLIVVPDAPLNSFPFAALSRTGVYRPLARDFQVTVAPSASTWVMWQRERRAPRELQALVVMHPGWQLTPATQMVIDPWRSNSAVALSELPGAQLEAQDISRALPATRVWSGGESSEGGLKAMDLRTLDVLHISAHALLDDRHPDRSAVVLAPGSDAEDGLLQVHEIARLPLAGQLVTLASCQSALGADVSGEGVLSVARAFLTAGAGAVIATLWPVEDAATAVFFRHFYTALADGKSVNGALQTAQIELMDAGLGPDAWAGFVVLGNGSWRQPAAQETLPAALWLVLFAILALPGAALWVTRYRR